MQYTPLNYDKINAAAGTTNPSQVKSYNNRTFAYWQRSLFQRACSVLEFELPDEWQGSTRDFFYFCLFRYGFVTIFNSDVYGITFQPCNISGYDWYYQPVDCLISNPALNTSLDLKIGEECEILKLTPDYQGIWDIITYYAEKLSSLDNAINMSIINNKFAFLWGARNKTAAEALKKMLDKINKGEPAVIFDMKLLKDPQDKEEPFQFLERSNLSNSYITDKQLMDFQTILNAFDAEVGIPTIPYQKKERMVTSEADSRQIDSTSRSVVWFDTLKSSLSNVKKLYPDIQLDVSLRYALDDSEEVTDVE